MAGNPPWRNPPLQEAIFEIRFPPVKDYSLFMSELRIKHRDLFPVIKTLTNVNLPESMIISGQVRHRFIGKNNDIIFQVGQNTLSINIIKYSGFDKFKNYIKDIVSTLCESIKIEDSTQMSLRYINKFDKTQDPFDILNIKFQFPTYNNSKTKGIQINYTKEESKTFFISTNVIFPINNEDLILDINALYTDKIANINWNLDSIIEWTEKSHNLIYDNFESLVSEGEKEKRK